jgi:hypothetical protein
MAADHSEARVVGYLFSAGAYAGLSGTGLQLRATIQEGAAGDFGLRRRPHAPSDITSTGRFGGSAIPERSACATNGSIHWVPGRAHPAPLLIAAWLMLASWKYAAKHDQQDDDTPKMPGEPKRVQPSRNRDLTSKNNPD